jgi:hypothetical protein
MGAGAAVAVQLRVEQTQAVAADHADHLDDPLFWRGLAPAQAP